MGSDKQVRMDLLVLSFLRPTTVGLREDRGMTGCLARVLLARQKWYLCRTSFGSFWLTIKTFFRNRMLVLMLIRRRYVVSLVEERVCAVESFRR